jgi:MSP (Major sperm protein) domain
MRLGVDTLLTASLRNASPSYIAFKVKTTATERYRVRPNIGVGAWLPSPRACADRISPTCLVRSMSAALANPGPVPIHTPVGHAYQPGC